MGVLEIATIAIRYTEAAVLGLLVVSLGLLFLRNRPPALVWYSALTTVVLVVHLYLEHGRWQLVPAYVLTFVFAFWLARPAGGRSRSARGKARSTRAYRGLGLALRIVFVVIAVPALLLPFAAPIFVVGDGGGRHPVGFTRMLIDGAQGTRHVDVWYPATGGSDLVAPFWSRDDLSAYRLPGWPALLSSHLALVPTPAGLRARILDEPLPLLVLMPGPDRLPGDFLHLVLEAASHGWLVAAAPPASGEEWVYRFIDALSRQETDAALAGRVDADRLAILVSGASSTDLGVPTLRLGEGVLLEAALPASRFAVYFADAEIPASALTIRYLMARPARLVVGSSDVPPDRLDSALRSLVGTILADGSSSAPVFSARPPDQQALLAGIEGASIRRLSDPRR